MICNIRKTTYYLSLIIIAILFNGCGIYSFSGGSVGDAETIQIDFFKNEAAIIQPTVSQTFTQELQDLFLSQTNLRLVNDGGDLHFEGEIVEYRETAISGTGDNTAAQTRLTISVNVIYTNKLKEEDDFEKKFSFYSDIDSSQQFIGDVLETALEEINERITQDIFNESVAKW